MHIPASSNGKDGRFSVYKSEFDSLCEYQRVGEELWNMRDTRRAFSPHPYSLGWSRYRPQLYPSNSVWSESRTLNPLVIGSNPIWGTNYEDVAQSVEHMTFNHGGVGSIPTILTILVTYSN